MQREHLGGERLEGGGWTTPGSKPFCIETPIGNIGIVICYDGDFPELARVTTLQHTHTPAAATVSSPLPPSHVNVIAVPVSVRPRTMICLYSRSRHPPAPHLG